LISSSTVGAWLESSGGLIQPYGTRFYAVCPALFYPDVHQHPVNKYDKALQ
jgi:hypothetical protein